VGTVRVSTRTTYFVGLLIACYIIVFASVSGFSINPAPQLRLSRLRPRLDGLSNPQPLSYFKHRHLIQRRGPKQ
jgi:hypothetical protein